MDESFRGINGDGDCRASDGEERRVQLRGGAAAAHLRQADRRHQQARRGAERRHLGT